MVKLINKLTGGTMYVADERAEEYKAAGNKPAVEPLPPKKPAVNKPKAKKK